TPATLGPHGAGAIHDDSSAEQLTVGSCCAAISARYSGRSRGDVAGGYSDFANTTSGWSGSFRIGPSRRLVSVSRVVSPVRHSHCVMSGPRRAAADTNNHSVGLIAHRALARSVALYGSAGLTETGQRPSRDRWRIRARWE